MPTYQILHDRLVKPLQMIKGSKLFVRVTQLTIVSAIHLKADAVRCSLGALRLLSFRNAIR